MGQPDLGLSDDQAPIVNVLSRLSHEIHQLTSKLASASDTSPSSFNHPVGGGKEDDDDCGRPYKRPRLLTHSPQYPSPRPVPRNTLEDQNEGYPSPPPIACLEALLAAYFTRVQPWVPIIQEAAFRRKIAEPRGRQKMSLVLHSMVFAALRFVTQDGKPLDADYVKDKTAKSRTVVVLNAMERLSVENLQALTILAFTEVSVSSLEASEKGDS